MSSELELAIRDANRTRYQVGQAAGHYESFFLRANEADRPLAFWIRYTIFSPEGQPEAAVGELWAVFFDGEADHHVAVKREVPLGHCAFCTSRFDVRIADAVLEPGRLEGAAASDGHAISWELTLRGEEPPLFLLPVGFYAPEVPRAKSLVGLPLAVFDGELQVDGRRVQVAGWAGSQNHNWGPRHTDHYAWGQVAGFDGHRDSFLELATARFRVGESWTPFATPMVLRHRGEEIALNSPAQAATARASFDYFTWEFVSESDEVSVEGKIWAPRQAFVGLTYHNPPGGQKYCLNTKIASCELDLTYKRSGERESLLSRHGAAFEILTEDMDHGVEISV